MNNIFFYAFFIFSIIIENLSCATVLAPSPEQASNIDSSSSKAVNAPLMTQSTIEQQLSMTQYALNNNDDFFLLLYFKGFTSPEYRSKAIALVNNLNNEGQTPLFVAISNHNLELYELLLSLGASTNAQLSNGDTLLHEAAQKRATKFIQPLLNAGLSVTAQNHFQQTPLHLAARTLYNEKIISLLLQHNASATEPDIDGNTPLHHAILGNSLLNTTLLLKHAPQVINQQNKLLQTPVHLAIQNKQEELVEALLQYKPSLDLVDESGNSLLHYAVKNGDKTLTRWLLNSGININLQNKNGETPLHLAAATNYDLYWYLITKGSNTSILSKKNLTAAQVFSNRQRLNTIIGIGTTFFCVGALSLLCQKAYILGQRDGYNDSLRLRNYRQHFNEWHRLDNLEEIKATRDEVEQLRTELQNIQSRQRTPVKLQYGVLDAIEQEDAQNNDAVILHHPCKNHISLKSSYESFFTTAPDDYGPAHRLKKANQCPYCQPDKPEEPQHGTLLIVGTGETAEHFFIPN
jgi:ankyrin repeat protein